MKPALRPEAEGAAGSSKILQALIRLSGGMSPKRYARSAGVQTRSLHTSVSEIGWRGARRAGMGAVPRVVGGTQGRVPHRARSLRPPTPRPVIVTTRGLGSHRLELRRSVATGSAAQRRGGRIGVNSIYLRSPRLPACHAASLVAGVSRTGRPRALPSAELRSWSMPPSPTAIARSSSAGASARSEECRL